MGRLRGRYYGRCRNCKEVLVVARSNAWPNVVYRGTIPCAIIERATAEELQMRWTPAHLGTLSGVSLNGEFKCELNYKFYLYVHEHCPVEGFLVLC